MEDIMGGALGNEVQHSGYGGYADSPKSLRRMTIREELNSQIAGLESMLKNKKEMVILLDENPAIEKFMNLSRNG